jgi:predicted Zn-dependent peptidase
VLFGIGSRYEKENEAGISHFLEHMMFKGTTQRPNTLILSQELDGIGAEFNAFTSKDVTGYYIKANSEHLARAIEILSDMLFNSKMEQAEIEREKGTIIEEINMYEDNPKNQAEEALEKILFEKNSLGREVAGTKKTVAAVNQQSLLSYWQKNYQPQRCVITVAGNLIENKTKKSLEKFFGRAQASARSVNFIKFKPQQKQPRLFLKYKKTEQAHLTLGFIGPKFGEPDFLAAKLLGVILGGSMSSRLFINIRERHGLCYYIRASHDTYEDVGATYLQAGLDKKRIYLAIKMIFAELKKIKTGVSPAELKKAKEFIKGHIIMEMEDSAAVADWYGKQELFYRQHKTPAERIKELEKVTVSALTRVARKIFVNQKINLAIVGPYRSVAEFKKLLKI